MQYLDATALYPQMIALARVGLQACVEDGQDLVPAYVNRLTHLTDLRDTTQSAELQAFWALSIDALTEAFGQLQKKTSLSTRPEREDNNLYKP